MMFGSQNLVVVILAVALASAFAHIAVGGVHTHQLGASGVVFAFILLNSLVSAKYGKIPISFLLVATLWIGDEAIKFFSESQISHHAHIAGGVVGAMAGFYFHKQKHEARMESYVAKFKSSLTKRKTK